MAMDDCHIVSFLRSYHQQNENNETSQTTSNKQHDCISPGPLYDSHQSSETIMPLECNDRSPDNCKIELNPTNPSDRHNSSWSPMTPPQQ